MKIGQRKEEGPQKLQENVMFTSCDQTGPAHSGRPWEFLPERENSLIQKTARDSWDGSVYHCSKVGRIPIAWNHLETALTYQSWLWSENIKKLLTLGWRWTLKR